MPDLELDLRSHMLREEVFAIKSAPPDKSLHQVRDEAIERHLHKLAEDVRLLTLSDDLCVGHTPDDAVKALAASKGWGEVTKISDMDGEDPNYTWGRRFVADEGTSFKAGGRAVPGGVVLTWWK